MYSGNISVRIELLSACISMAVSFFREPRRNSQRSSSTKTSPAVRSARKDRRAPLESAKGRRPRPSGRPEAQLGDAPAPPAGPRPAEFRGSPVQWIPAGVCEKMHILENFTSLGGCRAPSPPPYSWGAAAPQPGGPPKNKAGILGVGSPPRRQTFPAWACFFRKHWRFWMRDRM